MKFSLYIITLFLFSISFFACESNDDEGDNKKIRGTEMLETYSKVNNLTPATESGIYIITTTEGTGNTMVAGCKVDFKYKCTLLDGSVVKTSYTDSKENTFTYNLGDEQILPGLEEALTFLKKGQKATIILPWETAYEGKTPNFIPYTNQYASSKTGSETLSTFVLPYSPLIFEVEIVFVRFPTGN